MSKFRLILYTLLLASSAYAAELVLTWEKGYSLPGTSTELVPVGYFTGNSQNIIPNLDGTCSKRPGRWRDGGWASTTSATKDTNLSVNLMANLSNSLRYYPRNWGLVAIDDRFYKRNNENRTWTYLSTPAGLVTDATDDLQATEMGGELIVGGDISALAHFDGDSLFRLIIPMPYDSTAGTGDTTKADDRIAYDATIRGWSELEPGSVHWYAFTWVNRQGYETALSGPIKCPALTATALKCSIGVLLTKPIEFSTSIDTSQIVKRNIYCSVDSGATYTFVTALPPQTTTLIDSGQYNWNLQATTGPDDNRTISASRFPTVFQSQLWQLGPAVMRRSLLTTNASLSSSASTITVTPSIKNVIGKCLLEYSSTLEGAAITDLETDGENTVITSPDSKFIDNGVIPGDYIVVTSTVGNGPIAKVVSVISNTQVVIDSAVITDAMLSDNFAASIGNNIIQIDNEIIGIAGATSIYLYTGDVSSPSVLARGLFGTTATTHASGTPIYLIDPNVLGNPMYKSLVNSVTANPIRQLNAEDPFILPVKDVTGLFVGNGYLGIAGKTSFHALRGTSEFYVQPITENVGNISPRALVPYGGGAFALDGRGVYYVTESQQTLLSRDLGKMMRDSAAVGYYEKASAAFYDGHYYLSIPKNGTTKECITYVADMARNSSGDQPVWTRYTGWNPRSFATWDSAGVSGFYFGEWDSATVFKVDETKRGDASSMTTVDSIYVQVDSPTLRIPGSFTTWESCSFTMDTNDSVTVIGTFSNGYNTFTQTLFTVPKADSSSAAGQMREYNFDINQSADTMQITVKQKSKTSRFVLGPMRVYLSPGRRR